MNPKKIQNMSTKQAGKIIDEQKLQILDLQKLLPECSNRIEKNRVYMRIENRRFIIEQLNKRFFCEE